MSRLTDSLSNSKTHTEPWEYTIFKNALSNEQINEIIKSSTSKKNYVNDGTRSGNKNSKTNKNHPFRLYLTKDNINKYPALLNLITELQSVKVRKLISKIMRLDHIFENSFVRLEVIDDQEGFWLEKHCDIEEKLISSLIYVNKTNEDTNIGTDLYDINLEYVTTIPFEDNLGYFFCGPNKWHGVEKNKKIKKARKALQLNYVTFETDWPVDK